MTVHFYSTHPLTTSLESHILQLSGHKVFREKGANILSFEATILTEKFSKKEEKWNREFPLDKMY